MSGGLKASTIPNNVRKMIQNIKEITGNHIDENEIYAMLKECAMDPNETAQKLLLQDTFHEVKRRRDRKKETFQDIEDPQWRSGGPGRGGRGSRRSYTSRHAAQDAGGGISIHAKENGINQASNKVGSASSASIQEAKKKDARSSVTDMLNDPVDGAAGGTRRAVAPELSFGRDAKEPQLQSHSGVSKRPDMSRSNVESIKPATFSNVGSQASDTVLDLSDNMCSASAVGSIKCDAGSQDIFGEPNSNVSPEDKLNAGKVIGKSQGVGKNNTAELLQSSSLNHGSSSSSRPSSNYGSRPQQALGSQKGSTKEWKPKAANTNNIQGAKMPASDGSVVAKSSAHTQCVESTTDAGHATNKCHKELENLHVKNFQHVIIPNHIHVPEAVRTSLSFGSFDSAFMSSKKSSESEMDNSNSLSQTEQVNEESVEESSSQKMVPGEAAEYVDHSQSPKHAGSLSTGDVSAPAGSVPDFNDSKEADIGSQHSIQTSGYNLGLLPPMLGNRLGSVEASETQARDAPSVSSFVVQPVDPSSFCAQFYRSGSDSDGRISPFPAHAVASKYSGNGAVLSSQTSQSLAEGVNSLVLSTAAQTLITTQAAAVMPNSVAVTQQPVPLFRQSAGIHIPHYPPNYIPYGHYFPPFYVPPPAMHQFLGNSAFPQQAQAGSVYPPQPVSVASPAQVKFPMPQYKPAGNAGNSMHIGISGGYVPHGASPAGYNLVSAVTAGNSIANEDLSSSQFKENNLYITGQQSEGSAMWIPAPGLDMANIPNSFYNLVPQGQHVTFAPTQAGQGTFAGIYHPHPAQTATAAAVHPLLQQTQPIPGAVEMGGPTANVYQQSQHAQISWPNNY